MRGEDPPSSAVCRGRSSASSEDIQVEFPEDEKANQNADVKGKGKEEGKEEAKNFDTNPLHGDLSAIEVCSIIDDGVRVRLLNIWAFLLIYVFFVFGVLKFSEKIESQVTVLNVATPMPHYALAGRLDNYLRSTLPEKVPKVGVFDQNGNAVRGVKLSIDVLDFVPVENLAACSTVDLKKMAGTLRALKYRELCKLPSPSDLLTEASSDVGIAEMKALEVDGPAGLYTFAVKYNNVTADTLQKTFLESPVDTITIVDPEDVTRKLAAPSNATIGKALEKQPVVRIFDANGYPVSNRTVVAFAHADPTWPPTGPMRTPPPLHDARGQKIAELACARSLPSDENGLARFECLGVQGATADHLFFVFSESASVFVPWNDPGHSPRTLYPISNFMTSYRYPTRIVTTVHSVKLLHAAYSAGVQEGLALEPPPQVQVLSSGGAAVPDTWCYAIITASSGDFYPQYFQRQLTGTTRKELLNARAKTGADGIAHFRNLSVSIYGNTKTRNIFTENSSSTSLNIGFVCDGRFPDGPMVWHESSLGYIPKISSSVATVRLKRTITKSAFLATRDEIDNEDQSVVLSAVVRVLDSHDHGVAGKMVEVRSEGCWVFPIAKTREPTGDAGFSLVKFAVGIGPNTLRANKDAICRVRFFVDGIDSEVSDFTVKQREAYNPSACHIVLLTNVVTSDPQTGATVTTSVFTGEPLVYSGETAIIQSMLFGQTTDSFCVHYPALAPAGGANFSECNGTEIYANSSGSPGNFSGDGEIKIDIVPAYSNAGELTCEGGRCRLNVEHEPESLLDIVSSNWDLPTLKNHSAKPGVLQVQAMFQGPQGHHFIKLRATLTPPGTVGSPQTCESPVMKIQVRNEVVGIDVEGDDGGFFTTKAYVNQPLRINVKIQAQDPHTLEGIDPSTLKDYGLHSGASKKVFWRWAEIPAPQSSRVGTGSQGVANNDMYSMQEVDASGNAGVGWDGTTGTLRLSLTMKQNGTFGKWGLLFGTSGLWSRVFTFEVPTPEKLALEVVKEPDLGPSQGPNCVGIQVALGVQPEVRVVSGDAKTPVVGAVLYAELKPESGSHFARLTDIPGVSPLPFIHSEPTDSSGLAVWTQLTAMDGHGSAFFNFVLIPGEVQTGFMNESLQFCNSMYFNLKSKPPASLPLKTPLSALPGASLEVELEVREPTTAFPPLLCPSTIPTGFDTICKAPGEGFLVIRMLVAMAGNKELSRNEAKAASRRMLQEQVCLWVDGKEYYGRCSDLEYVQASPVAIIRFKVLSLKWMKVSVYPATIRLQVSDLSGTTYGDFAQLPDKWANMSAAEQAMTCIDELQATQEYTASFVTGAIQAEMAPASALVILAPPKVVEVGQVFLVKLALRTKSGGPVSGRAMRACIALASSTSASTASPGFLQMLTSQGGFSQSSACNQKVASLAADGVVRVSAKDGTVSFPLTVQTARSGTYKILFQPEEPGAKVMSESVAFKVHNPVARVSSAEGPWGTVQVDKFGEVVKVPMLPTFRVETEDGKSLHDLEDEGFDVTIKVEIRCLSESRFKATRKVNGMRKAAAEQAAQATAKEVEKLVAKLSPELASATLEGAIDSQFPFFTPEFVAACKKTAASALGFGDPNNNETDEVQEPSMSDVVKSDPSAIQPGEMFGQFVGVLTGGGSEMVSPETMQPIFSQELKVEDLTRYGNLLYKFKEDMHMNFQPNFRYQFVIFVNGVQGDDFPLFMVELKPPSAEEAIFSWIVGAIAAILGLIGLATNTTKHHHRWLVGAMLATIVIIIVVPYIKQYHDALGGYWTVLAYINLSFILLALVYGFFVEMGYAGFRTFEQRRMAAYEEYCKNKLFDAIVGKRDLQPTLMQNIKDMVSPFSAKTAFFFPSNFLTASFISVVSFLWIFAQSVQTLRNFDATISAMLTRAMVAIHRQVRAIDEQFYASFGQDLPKEATQFLFHQLEIVVSWFKDLSNAIELGFKIGIGLASVTVTAVLIFTFYDFRRQALALRRGKPLFDVDKSGIVGSAQFIGIHISSTIIGYGIIVFISTLVCVPIAWPLLRDYLWTFAPLLITILVPVVLNVLVSMLFTNILFGPDFITNRPLASLFYFWQTYISILSGIVGAIKRFALALVSVLIMLPCICGAATPERIQNSGLPGLPDATYGSYLSAIRAYHVHNAPVLVVACHRLRQICAARQEFRERGLHWTSSRSLLLLVLMRFPALRKLRKHALQAKAEAEEEAIGKQMSVVSTAFTKCRAIQAGYAAEALGSKEGSQRAIHSGDAAEEQGSKEGSSGSSDTLGASDDVGPATHRSSHIEHILSKAQEINELAQQLAAHPEGSPEYAQVLKEASNTLQEPSAQAAAKKAKREKKQKPKKTPKDNKAT